MFLSWSWNKALWKQRSVQNGFQDQCFQKQRNLGGNSEHWKNIEIQTILKLSMVSRWFGTNTLQGHFATMFQKMFLEKPFQWFFTWFYNVFKMFFLNPFDPAPSGSGRRLRTAGWMMSLWMSSPLGLRERERRHAGRGKEREREGNERLGPSRIHGSWGALIDHR